MSTSEQNVRKRIPSRTSLSRSPHPYHRRNQSLKHSDESSSSTDVHSTDVNRLSESNDDQVLEADDEKGPLLRLPAPPVKPRKGLRGGNDPSIILTPAISPLPSPGEERSGFSFRPLHNEKIIHGRPEIDVLHAKYIKRRRTEIVRRATEALLLCIIGIISAFDRDKVQSGVRPGFSPEVIEWKHELLWFGGIVCVCYVSYPARRVVQFSRAGLTTYSALRRGFRVPSRFDPGILLYPVLLPLFIAMSLGAYNPALPINLVLGLSSMPAIVVPGIKLGPNKLHWILTLVPVAASPISNCRLGRSTLDPVKSGVNTEEISLLFILHENLVSVIAETVTTSLDPAEIQLLSAGLINLLLFASMPQFQILKALLWVGGLCIFLFCEFALRAEVSLARIPAWRFARNRPSNKGLKGRLNRVLQALLPESRSRFAVSSSDSDDEVSPMLGPPRRTRTFKRVQRRRDLPENALQKTISADENHPNGILARPDSLAQVRRSSTFSMYGRAATMAIKWKTIAKSPNPYPRLNYLHARTLKILLAAYVYVAVTLIILLPVKYFISQRALGGTEAIGWAVGYFVGDIAGVRRLIVNNNLEKIVRLPINKLQQHIPAGTAWSDRVRRQAIGAANARLLLAAYCVIAVGIGIAVVLRLQRVVEVDTRRKVFHGVMVAMLLPTIPIDPSFFSLALMIVLAVFLMLDTFRASQLPPISRPLTNFLAPYVDGRDYRGPVIVSHIFLLIGCAIPLWLSLSDASRSRDEYWELSWRDLSMVSGVICVGMGDAAASLIGRRYGRTKWYWGGGKSIEGSAAFAVAVMVGIMASWAWLRLGGWADFRISDVPGAATRALAAGMGASIMESTLTAANDNVVVPIGLWLLVRGLRI